MLAPRPPAAMRLGQRHFRVGAKVKLVFLAVGAAVLETPLLGAGRTDFQVEAAAIEQLAGGVTLFCMANLEFRQGWDTFRHFGGRRPD